MSTAFDQLDLAIIVASTRQNRFAPVVGDWFAAQAKTHADFVPDVVDLAAAALPATLIGHPDAAVERFAARLAAADAFVIVTPEYNHSYPASIKHAIDLTGREWHAKPVAFVSYGGISGGLRAVEHLRGVLAEMHAVTIRDTVSFHGAWARFDADGHPNEPDGPSAAARKMLDQLAWWAHSLRDARRSRPYAA